MSAFATAIPRCAVSATITVTLLAGASVRPPGGMSVWVIRGRWADGGPGEGPHFCAAGVARSDVGRRRFVG
ncbi:hypothetical protein AB852_14285 [Streptomyces uncialis]|uniref:Uncharacterized protein n=1 Tax=Streptomyces uncialis TaxID=1048205 RepID=A0A1Q4V7P9_9ACTN|nr:hypothetical protein AB852_14285 [Streptomyces uncialis]